MFLRIVFILSLFIFIVACAQKANVSVKNSSIYNENQSEENYIVPQWVLSPSGEGYIGGVGKCGIHVNGPAGQRELAISRAIDDIARQMQVSVDNILVTTQNISSSGVSSSFATSESSHKVMHMTVEAYIADTWTHPRTKELYIYMRAK